MSPAFKTWCCLLGLGLLLVALPITGQSAPSDAEGRAGRDRGVAAALRGDYREAYALLLPWVRAHPEDQEARLRAAWSAAYLDRTFEAAEILVGLEESDPRVQFLWGKLLMDKRDPEGALEALTPLLAQPPEGLELEVRRLMARASMEVGRADQAVELLTGRQGDDPRVSLELALARYESGDLGGAREVLAPHATAALSLFRSESASPPEPLTIALLFEYGRLLVAAADHATALEYLAAAVEGAPECKQCWQQLAQAYAASGQRDEARRAQERFEALVAREAPLEEAQRQAALDRQDPTGRVLRQAGDLMRAGRTGEALSALEAESRLRPGDPRPYLAAARILLDGGHGAQALELASTAVEVAPEYPDAHYWRGAVRRQLGDRAGARKDFERALELDPEHRRATADLSALGEP